MTVGDVNTRREIPDPPGIAHARTLPAAWYADHDFYATEREAVFRSGWVCAGVTDELRRLLKEFEGSVGDAAEG